VRFILLGGEASVEKEEADGNLILFSGNDYIGLSSHPAIREAAVKVF
jgi:8-amino-7-oxononanoate synthase